MHFKKLSIIILIFVAVFAAVFLYFYFAKFKKIEKEPQKEDTFQSYLKTDSLSRDVFPISPKISDIATPFVINKIKNKKIYFPKFYNQFFYYLSEDGRLFQETLISEETINLLPLHSFNPQSLEDVKWNLPKYVAIFSSDAPAEYAQNNFVEELWMDIDAEHNKKIYNLENENSTILDKKIKDLIWSQEGNSIYYYIYNETEKNSALFQADAEGKNAQEITKISGEKIYFAERSQKLKNKLYFLQYGETGTNLLEVDLINNQTQILFKNIDRANFSPDGKYFLGNKRKNDRLNVFLFNLETKETKDLSRVFLAENALWSENLIYLIIGENVNFDSENEPNYIGTYAFWKYDIIKDEFIQLTNLSRNKKTIIDPVDMELVNDKIYFTNLSDQALYTLDLR